VSGTIVYIFWLFVQTVSTIKTFKKKKKKVCGVNFHNPFPQNIEGSLFLCQEDVNLRGLLVSGVVVREKAMPVKTGLKMSNNLEFKILVLDNTPYYPQDLVPI
jgi:hypothetical protein